jgi:hypothetical protein
LSFGAPAAAHRRNRRVKHRSTQVNYGCVAFFFCFFCAFVCHFVCC